MKNIFVSSTFSDFQEERDILRNNVMSRLNQLALKYGEYVTFSDLRWGIYTSSMNEEEAVDMILSSCLDEIDRTSPYMVIMLGDRYGYLPGKEAIQREADRKNISLEDAEISVTHLEIEYGAFNNENTDHIYVYLKNPESPDCETDQLQSAQEAFFQTKFHTLKERLKKMFGKHVHTYNPCDVQNGTFADMVFSDLSGDFQQDWDNLERMSVYWKERLIVQNAIEEKAAYFQAFTQTAADLQSKLCASDHRIITLMGGPGSGKTTMFAFLASSFRRKGWDTISILSGNTVLSMDEKLIAYTITWQLEHILNVTNELIYKEDTTAPEIKDYLQSLYSLYEKTGRDLFLGVDAIEQIVLGFKQDKLWFLPENHYDHIHVLLTTWKEELANEMGYDQYQMPVLNREEMEKVIKGILRHNGKTLPKTIIEEIAGVPAADNPFMLYLMVNRLCIMNREDYEAINQKGGGNDEIVRYQINILRGMPQNPEGMAKHILKYMSDLLNLPQAMDAMHLMAASRYGLRFSDLSEILKSKNKELLPLHFSRYINLIFDLFLIRNDGRIDFIHQSFRLSMQHNATNAYDELIARYLLDLPRNDTVRKQEVTYHLIKAELEELLIYEISKVISKVYDGEGKDAARDLYYVQNETPDYIFNLLDHQLHEKGLSEELIDFVNFYNNYVVKSSYDSIESIDRELTILGRLLVWLKGILPSQKDSDLFKKIQYSIIWICTSIARLNMKKHTNEAYAIAQLYYHKGIEYAEELYASDPSAFAAMELGITYYETADFLERFGEKSIEELTIRMNEMAYKMATITFEKQGYSTLPDLRNYMLFARALANRYIDQRDGKMTQTAIELLVQTIQAVKDILPENMPLDLLEEYGKLHQSLGNAYSNSELINYNEEAIYHYKKSLELSRQCYLDSGKKGDLYDIAVSYISLARGYKKYGDRESLLRAVYYSEEAIRCSKSAYARFELFDYISIYVSALAFYAEVVSELGDNDLIMKGREAIYEGLNLISEVSNAPAIELVSFRETIMRGLTSIAFKTRNRDALLTLVKIADSEREKINDKYFRENYNKSLLSSLSSIYDCAAMACQILGDHKSYEAGIQFAKESIKMLERIIEEEEDSVFWQRNLEVSLFKLGALLSETEEDADLILPYYERGLDIASKLANVSDTYQIQYDYGFALMRNAEVLKKKNDRESLIKAREYVTKAIEVRDNILENGNTGQHRENLAYAYSVFFDICLKLGDMDTAEYSIEKAFNILNGIPEKEQSPGYLEQLADCEIQYARYLIQLKRDPEAIRYYKSANCHYSAAFSKSGTFLTFRKYISSLLQTGYFYAKGGNYDETIDYIQTAVDESKKYFEFDEKDEHRVCVVDIYMEAEQILEQLIEAVEEPSKVYSAMIEMYKTSINVYYDIVYKSSVNDTKFISNLSALYIGLARIFDSNNQEDEAVFYYNSCIDMAELRPDGGRSSFVLITNQYRSYAEKGLIYVYKNDFHNAYSLMVKAVDHSLDAAKYFTDEKAQVDILDDLQDYARFAAQISYELKEFDWAIMYVETAMLAIEKLNAFGLKHNYQDQYIKLQRLYSIITAEAASSPVRASHKIDDELQKMYDDAERELFSDEKRAGEMFLNFLNAESEVPDGEKSIQTLIYSYNAWSQLAAIEMHKEKKQMITATDYLLRAIQRELEILKLPASKNRKEEIVSDLSQDALLGMKICSVLKDKEKAEIYMKALIIARANENL